MKVRIYGSTGNSGTMVNKFGKYLKNHFVGAFKITFSSMSCQVYIRMYYQVPHKPESLKEMHFIIDITSYQDKLRVNLSEDTIMEKTIGQVILKEDDLSDMQIAQKKVFDKLIKCIKSEYEEFDFVF